MEGQTSGRESHGWMGRNAEGCVGGGGLAPAVSEGLQRAWSPAQLPGCLCGGEGEPAGCPPDHRPTQQERSWAQARPGSQRRDDAGRKSPHGPQAQCHPHGSPFRSLILLLRLSNKKQIPAGPATHRGLGECQWGLTTSSCCFLSLSPSSSTPVSCRVLFPLAPRPGSSLEPHFQLCTLAACPPAWPPQACEAHRGLWLTSRFGSFLAARALCEPPWWGRWGKSHGWPGRTGFKSWDCSQHLGGQASTPDPSRWEVPSRCFAWKVSLELWVVARS